MNVVLESKREHAVELFSIGHSIREVCKIAGMAKETAHRIQKICRECELEMEGRTLIRTGGGSNIGMKHVKEVKKPSLIQVIQSLRDEVSELHRKASLIEEVIKDLEEMVIPPPPNQRESE